MDAPYTLARRGTDLCQLFTERDRHIIHPKSRCGFVLPSGWQTAVESTPFRLFLEAKFNLSEFVSLPYDTFEDAYVEACIVVSTVKLSDNNAKVRLLIYPKRECVTNIHLDDGRWESIDARRWTALDPQRHPWFTFLRSDELSIVEKISRESVQTAALAEVTRGVTPFRESNATKRVAPGLTGDLRRYLTVGPIDTPIEYHESLAEYRPPDVFRGPRVLLRELISRQFRLQADYAEQYFIVNKSVQIIHCGKDVSPRSLLACLNSALLSFYHTNISAIAQRDDFPKIVIDETRRLPLPKRLTDLGSDEPTQLDRIVKAMANLSREFDRSLTSFRSQIPELVGATAPLDEWSGGSRAEVDYFGWQARYPNVLTVPGDVSATEVIAPTLEGKGPAEIPWNLIARVYPSFPLPGIDERSWEAAAWNEMCDLLRKNKSKITNPRVKADLTGSANANSPIGPLKKVQDVFLEYHKQIRQNRAKAAELDFQVDQIVFRLFDLDYNDQLLILSRVGPGRPLPPRRGRKARSDSIPSGPTLFET